MMTWFFGIDIGASSTKAVLLAGDGEVSGRATTTAQGAYGEILARALVLARLDARLGLVSRVASEHEGGSQWASVFRAAVRSRVEEQREGAFRASLVGAADADGPLTRAVLQAYAAAREKSGAGALPLRESSMRRRFVGEVEAHARSAGLAPGRLLAVYDKAAARLQASVPDDVDQLWMQACLAEHPPPRAAAVAVYRVATRTMTARQIMLTGYARRSLDSDGVATRGELLCLARGAHELRAGPQTVLDVGGRDAKVLQLDECGQIASFQVNDRCAAGAGRFLGHAADALDIDISELAARAASAAKPARVSSSCTVFAAQELRERLALGEPVEQVLAGIHRAAMTRSVGLLARAGAPRAVVTFSGGVALNPTAVAVLTELVRAHFGEVAVAVPSAPQHLTAFGAALLAREEVGRDG